MNKYVLIGVVAFLIIAGGWWYSNTMKNGQGFQTNTTETVISDQDRATSITIGQRIGAFTVESKAYDEAGQRFYQIQLSGITTLTGTYSDSDASSMVGLPTFSVVTSDRVKIPYDWRGDEVCLRNEEFTRQALDKLTGTITIEVKDYRIDMRETEVCDSVELVRVIH